MRQSGGFSKLETALGDGTTVTIYLPRYAAIDALPDTAPELPATGRGNARGATVLVVEDEPGVRAMTVEALSDLGCRILEAGDGNTALRIVESERQIDILLTDVGLPGLNGRQLAAAARHKRPDIPIALITGYVGAALDGWDLHPEWTSSANRSSSIC